MSTTYTVNKITILFGCHYRIWFTIYKNLTVGRTTQKHETTLDYSIRSEFTFHQLLYTLDKEQKKKKSNFDTNKRNNISNEQFTNWLFRRYLHIWKTLTGTLSGYFRRIFSPSAFLFSNECSSLYWNFILSALSTKAKALYTKFVSQQTQNLTFQALMFFFFN